MSRLSPRFKENVMARIEAHQRMAALYSKAYGEGFRILRDPDRRGVVVAMPKDMLAGDVLEGPVDPRFATLADVMEHESQMFDFIEAHDRLTKGVLEDDGYNPVAGEGFVPPGEAVPLVAGGQGRDAEEVRADVRALFVAGLVAVVLGLGYGTVALCAGWFPFETVR